MVAAGTQAEKPQREPLSTFTGKGEAAGTDSGILSSEVMAEVTDTLEQGLDTQGNLSGSGQPPAMDWLTVAPLPCCALLNREKLRDLAEAVSRILALLGLKKTWQISNREWFLEQTPPAALGFLPQGSAGHSPSSLLLLLLSWVSLRLCSHSSWNQWMQGLDVDLGVPVARWGLNPNLARGEAQRVRPL